MPPKKAGPGLTTAQREAAAAFKPIAASLTSDQQAKLDFDQNRERLKALRLERDAQLTSK